MGQFDPETSIKDPPASRPSYAPPVDVVHIGPYDYRISYRSSKQMPEYYGLTSKSRATIILLSDQSAVRCERLCCTN